MKKFEELRVWQCGLKIAVDCFKLIETFPKQERFGLSSQITRAAVSMPSNIAEGSSRISEKDYRRFLEIALGSSFELQTQLLIARAANFGDPAMCEAILLDLATEQRMLVSFMKAISNQTNSQ